MGKTSKPSRRPQGTDGISLRRRRRAAFLIAAIAIALAAWQIWRHTGKIRTRPLSEDWQSDERMPESSREPDPSHPRVPPMDTGSSIATNADDPEVAGLMQDAVRVAQYLSKEYPTDVGAIDAVARMHRRLGHADLAVADWQRCLSLDPEFIPAYLGIGSVLVERGEYDEAETVLRKAQTLAPISPQVAVILATALMNQGKLRETVVVLEAHARDANAPMPCFLLLGQACLQLHDDAKAKSCFEAVVRMSPDFAGGHYGLATSCARLGRSQEAEEHRKRFQEAEASRLARQIEVGKQRDDTAAVRNSVAEAYAAAAAVCSAHGNASRAEQHRRDAKRLGWVENHARR